ncbi:hypothetical protein [Psychroserpens sp.]|uniref:hypothetical protein n=1 Tax=Psychroserpens sp. TaxID=2020870 RepID=UPI003C707CA9
MRKIFILLLLWFGSFQFCAAQDWLTSMEAAKRLALIQDKMILMVWEEAASYAFPVIVEDEKGNKGVIDNMFENEYVKKWLWEHFVLVIVNESYYAQLYGDINKTRTFRYIEKFNDDSLKVMDVNGNILNIAYNYDEIFNLSEFVRNYYVNTRFLKGEYIAYTNEKSFTSSYYLAYRYVDAAAYVNPEIRVEMIKMSNIYLDETKKYLEQGAVTDKASLAFKIELIEIYQDLVLDKPRKVLRQLNRLAKTELDPSDEEMIAFLYVAAYRVLNDEKSASEWRSKVSLLNLEKASIIISNSKL